LLSAEPNSTSLILEFDFELFGSVLQIQHIRLRARNILLRRKQDARAPHCDFAGAGTQVGARTHGKFVWLQTTLQRPEANFKIVYHPETDASVTVDIRDLSGQTDFRSFSMQRESIDWNRSIEQQIEEIVIATSAARRLVRQIGYKKDAHPELITRENYACFQSVIHSMAQLACEVEGSPLYKGALEELLKRQRRKQRQTVAKHFGSILLRGETSH
jgi:hypothetical protein